MNFYCTYRLNVLLECSLKGVIPSSSVTRVHRCRYRYADMHFTPFHFCWHLLGNANNLCDKNVVLWLHRLLPAYDHLDNGVQFTQQVRNSHLAYLDSSGQVTKQARNTQLAHVDNSVQSIKQARYTHLAYLGNLRLWSLLVAGLSWQQCTVHIAGQVKLTLHILRIWGSGVCW